jgi:hypothetical protein
MRCATVAILATIALLTNGCRNETRRSIRVCDPKLESVPPGNYPKVDLGDDSSKWDWVKKVGRLIEDVIVDPPVDANGPYQLGKDFSGTIEGDTFGINFKSAGVYAVKIVFQDKSIPPEVFLVFVSAFEN